MRTVSLMRLGLAVLLPGLPLSHTSLASPQANSNNNNKSSCTPETAIVRQEYGSLSTSEKLDFVSALQCVLSKPSLLHDTIPATTNKFDDFAAVHINMTTSIHFDGIFFAWHRHFVWLMERELHACGFPATLGMPYWNWTLWPDLETSPML